MSRIIQLFILVAGAVWLAVWFADHPGRVEIEMLGYAIYTEQVGLLVGGVVLFTMVVAVLYRVWRSLRRAPRRIVEYRRASKWQRGYRALTQGMVAVAAGDSKEAKRFARRSGKLLNDPPLTMLLSAQAAQLDGDEDAARHYFESMLHDPEMAFLGVRGLLMQAMRNDDQLEALRLAGQAQALRPNTPWVLEYLLELQVKVGQWEAADGTLKQVLQQGTLEALTGRRQRAVLSVKLCHDSAELGDLVAAAKYARRAHELDPGLVPAAGAYSKSLADAGKTRRATKVIETTWSLAPHPELATAYANLVGEDEAPLARLKRFQRLHGLRPDHFESHFVLAEASKAAQLWGEARRHIEQAYVQHCSVSVLRLLADLEEQQHGDLKAARRWLDEASTASKDNAWYCESCGSVAEKWGASCINCGSFATIIWKFPPGQNQNGLRDTEGKGNLDLKNEHDKTAVLRSSKSHLLTT